MRLIRAVSFIMHRGGIRRVSEGGSGRRGSGRGRRGGGGHPSGLSGKEIGLWYAARGKEKKKKKELTERDVVTMSSHKEERISRLLKKLQDKDSNQFSSHCYEEPKARYHYDNRHHYSNKYHHGSRYDERQRSARETDNLEGQYVKKESDKFIRGFDGDYAMKDESVEDEIPKPHQLEDNAQSLLWSSQSKEANEQDFSDNDDDNTEIPIQNDQTVEGEALCMSDELFAAAPQKSSLWDPPFGSVLLQRDAAIDKNLKKQLVEKAVSNRKYIEMQKFRTKLPSYTMKEELLDLIRKNQVVVISGETGCGKTTQVAQFILDDAIMTGQGSLCRIACTQPRRISAISVAERVAEERGEPCGGQSVGYQIRLDSKLPRSRGSIVYCTTGVLLRWLISDGLLHNISHVIIDEIHERDLMSDFLLIIVKDLLLKRPDLKLILMSATLNAEMFSLYFDGCPMAQIPGFTFPVKEYYVEDVIEMIRYQNQDSSRNQGNMQGPKWKRHEGVKSWAKKKRAEKMSFSEDRGEQDVYDEEVQWIQYLNSIKTRYCQSTLDCLENMSFDTINIDLVMNLIKHICTNLEAGAILVFLPGWDDISKLHDSLKNTRVFSSDKYLIIPLHSMMPTATQREVFERPPLGIRKIVLATNIAETSITIDDVVFVIDCGKAKEKSYDVSRKISCLMPVWISKASSRQRRGRAGRVQSGFCFHVFTEFQAQKLIDYQLPEMLRTPLEELCLQIKILKLGMVGEFLSKALQPPSSAAVQNALDKLKQLNALDHEECLTPLGYHLASLPVDPCIGKMILFGAIFSCLDPVLTIASTLGFKDPFVFPLDKKKQTDRVRMKFAGDTRSDHLAVLYAFKGWENAKRHNNDGFYCWENFLSKHTLKMLSDMKLQFARLLCDIGFLDNSMPKDSTANQNSDNLRLVKAVICAGLYPNVVKIEHHGKLKRPPKMFTREDGKVALHPKSVNVEKVVYENNWLIYHQKVKSSKVFIHDATMISPYPLLFFGGEISVLVEEGHEIIAVDDFIRFRSPRKIANLVKDLRTQLDRLLEKKISQPDLRLTAGSSTSTSTAEESGSMLLHAIIDLITTEDSKNWKRRQAMMETQEVSGSSSRIL